MSSTALAAGRRWHNWSGAVEAHPAEVLRPTSLEELREAVRGAAARGRTVRAVGSGHSFPPLCATDEAMLSLEGLSGVVRLAPGAREADVWAGTRLAELGAALHLHGVAMENLGDIDRQSLAGALSTGTHGTGAGLGVLASQVLALTLVDAGGELVECSPTHEPSLFHAAQVSLGALGVLARVRLRLEPAYRLELEKRTLGLEECLERLPELARTHRHFEFFWFPHSERVMAKLMDRTDQPAPAEKGLARWVDEVLVENGLLWLASEACRLVPSLSAAVGRLSARVAGEATVVDWSHRLFATPRLVRFQEMEYALPREAGPDALRELVRYIARERVQVHFPVEFRLVRGDDAWLSPAYGRDSAFIAVHQYRGRPLEPYFPRAEAILRAHGGRPHWGKLHSLTARELAPLYPRWEDFHAQRRRLDPRGRFLNPYLRRLFEA